MTFQALTEEIPMAKRKTAGRNRTHRKPAKGGASAGAKPRRRPRWHPSQESDELVFAVCDFFLSLGDGNEKRAVMAVVDWVQEHFGRTDIGRERVYPIFREGIHRRFVTLRPPLEDTVAQRIADLYGLCDAQRHAIHVANVEGAQTHDHVASAAAELVYSLIRRIVIEQGRNCVHLGLGVGNSSMKVARHLGDVLGSDPASPNLVVHALSSSGFMENEPDGVPINFVHLLETGLNRVDFVGLNAPPVIAAREYRAFRQSLAMQEARRRASEVDIVITAFACADHGHGVLNHYLRHLQSVDPNDVTRQLLLERGWVGDVQYVPYSKDGPIVLQEGLRSVVLFELPELVRMAQSGKKYVVLVGGPCSFCGQMRTRALLPLIEQPRLHVWTHLVTDIRTAAELLPPSWQGPGAKLARPH